MTWQLLVKTKVAVTVPATVAACEPDTQANAINGNTALDTSACMVFILLSYQSSVTVNVSV